MAANFPSLKLTCFDLGPRGEATRVTLFMAGIPFEDERLSHAQWPQLRDRFPYRKVPVLYVDGEEIAESQGILRYVGRLAGMYPVNDAVAAALVDELLACYEELFQNCFVATMRPDRDETRRLRDALFAGPLPQFLRQIDARLAAMEQYPLFHLNPQVYVHHVLTWDYVARFKRGFFGDELLTATNQLPAMTAAFHKVAAHPMVQLWVSSARESTRPKRISLVSRANNSSSDAIRLAFCIGGVAFEDERLADDEFEARRLEFPFGRLPVLLVDGHAASQSFALLRLAGTLAGLYPVTDPLAAARIDEVCGRAEELINATQPLTSEAVSQSLLLLERRISQWTRKDGGFAMGGGSITMADLVVHSLVQLLRQASTELAALVDECPTLTSVHTAVAGHPRVSQ